MLLISDGLCANAVDQRRVVCNAVVLHQLQYDDYNSKEITVDFSPNSGFCCFFYWFSKCPTHTYK